MNTNTPHLGTYIWTRADGSHRPMTGSVMHEKYQEAEWERKKAALRTPEGQAWLTRQEDASAWRRIIGDTNE